MWIHLLGSGAAGSPPPPSVTVFVVDLLMGFFFLLSQRWPFPHTRLGLLPRGSLWDQGTGQTHICHDLGRLPETEPSVVPLLLMINTALLSLWYG